jgi:hypothetical protein
MISSANKAEEQGR